MIISVGGLLVTALLLGLVSDTIATFFDSLKKGKADVIERGHTLILGWNDRVLPIIKEIALANDSEGVRDRLHQLFCCFHN